MQFARSYKSYKEVRLVVHVKSTGSLLGNQIYQTLSLRQTAGH